MDNPDTAYEEQCQTFATTLLQNDSPFLEDFIPFAYAVIRRSTPYSLAQLLLKLTAPGIPDIYQGAELWETSFVDPITVDPSTSPGAPIYYAISK